MRETLWMVLSLAGLLVVSSCSSYDHRGMMEGGKGDGYWQRGQKEMETLVDRTVKDQEKAKQVKAIVGEIVTELKAGREQERMYHRQLYTLNASYTASPEEFTKILDDGNNQRMRIATKILGLRFKMKDLMTADEWKALSDRMLEYSSRYEHGGSSPKSNY